MKYILMLVFMTACSASAFQAVDDIAETEKDAVSMQLSKEAFRKDTDVRITLDVLNKDQVKH
jgi:hypothetical protein